MKKTDWFASWFDTAFYHDLYHNRNEQEAELFISKLVQKINLPQHASVVDLACGKGRHSIYLNKLGFQVTGLDLAANSIEAANQFKNERLQFQVHDMRETFAQEQFSAVFNLFTSFGYFDDLSDNQRVIDSIHQMLLPEGLVVIDFMNCEKVIAQLVKEETKSTALTDYQIKRYTSDLHIFKNIQFSFEGQDYDFTERVQILRLVDFQKLLHEFSILYTFGDFELNPFNASTSDRLIIIAQKKTEWK